MFGSRFSLAVLPIAFLLFAGALILTNPAAAQVLGPQFFLDAGTESGDPRDVAVASDGTTYLIVYSVDGGIQVRSRRVGSSGQAVGDATSILAVSGGDTISDLDLVWWDDSYFLVFQINPGDGTSPDVWGMHLDTLGNPDGAAFVIAATSAWERNPRVTVVPGADEAVATWADHSSAAAISGRIRASRIFKVGGTWDTPGILVSSALEVHRKPDLAYSLGIVFVAFYTNDPFEPVQFTRLDPLTGTIVGSVAEQLAIGDGSTPHFDASPLRVATDGLNFLVVWEEGEGITDRFLNARTVSWDGVLLGTQQQITDPGGTAISPALDYQGSHYVLQWTDSPIESGTGTIFFQRLDGSGVPLFPDVAATTGRAGGDLVAGPSGETFHIYVHNDSDIGKDTAGYRVGASGTVISGPHALIHNHRVHGPPSFASDGTRFALAYRTSAPTGPGDILLSLFDDAGIPLGSSNVTADPWNQRAPHIDVARLSGLGTGYLVAYERDFSGIPAVYGARVDANGVVQDLGGIPWAQTTGIRVEQPRVMGRSTPPHAVVYRYRPASGTEIRLTYLDEFASPLTTHTASIISGATDPDGAAWDDGFFIVWQATAPTGDRDIFGRRFNLTGPIEPAPFRVASETWDQVTPRIAFDGTRFLVTWLHEDAGRWTVRGNFVTVGGIVEGPDAGFDVATYTGPAGVDQHFNAELAFDGQQYIAASDLTLVPPPDEDDATAMFGLLSTSGMPSNDTQLGSFAVSSRTAVASLGDGHSLFAYRVEKAVSWSGRRLALRTFDNPSVDVADPVLPPPAVTFRAQPNPFAGRTWITVRESAVAAAMEVGAGGMPIHIIDPAGRHVRTLELPAGSAGAGVAWDGRDARGRVVASGRYVAVLAIAGRAFHLPLVKLR